MVSLSDFPKKLEIKISYREKYKNKSWNDFNLRWDPDEFGNISAIRVQSSKIWIPGQLLKNIACSVFKIVSE